MRMRRRGHDWPLLLCCLLIPWMAAHGGTPSQSTQVILSSTPLLPPTTVFLSVLPDSVRIKMLAAIARGDIAGAISMWQLATGRDGVPPPLMALQTAFNVTNRVAGPCARVAKDILEGFRSVGGNPEVVRISGSQGNFISWQNRAMMSDNNIHFLIEYEGRFYDAFTGPMGLSRADYLKNLVMSGQPLLTRVSEEALLP